MINRRFFYYKTRAAFERDKSQIPNEAIVFIEDERIIWTHGQEYAGNIQSGNVPGQQQPDQPQEFDPSDIYSYINQKINELRNELNNQTNTPDPIDNPIDNSCHCIDKLITLTVQQYRQLVESNQVQEGMYYFTYEGEEEPEQSSSWVFGGTFPITFSGTWTFGDAFPIILTEGSTSNGVGIFPITLT